MCVCDRAQYCTVMDLFCDEDVNTRGLDIKNMTAAFARNETFSQRRFYLQIISVVKTNFTNNLLK